MSVKKTILDYFKCHKRRALLVILSIVLVTVLALLPAQILRIIVDDTIPNGSKGKLLKIALIYMSTYIAIGVFTFLKELLMLSTSLHITSNLRCNMMKHVGNLSYKSLVNSDSGTLEAYFNNDVNSINELFTSGVVNMATDLFKMIGIVVSIFIYSIRFGLIVLCLLPFILMFTSFVRKKMLKAQLKTKALEGNVNKTLLENIENIEQIKVNKAEKYAKEKYEGILKNHFKANQASNLYDGFFSPVMQMIRAVAICTILLVSGYNNDIFGMTIGMVISSISLLTDLFSPIENLGMEIQTIQKSVAAVKRINMLFKMEEDLEKEDYDIKNMIIKYDNVGFAYLDEEVIKDFNLTINSNDKIAFQGPSGSGKSTLMKLAMGIINPTHGKVTIDGYDIYKISDKKREELFSIVYQEPFFSGGTIYEEIALLSDNITKDDVRKALDLVGLEYIKNMDVILNDKEYSSGELALFNIARVVVRDAQIVFLDEMNAKIDPLTGRKIIDLINKISKDKIVISINHYGDILEGAKIVRLGDSFGN